MLWKKIKKLNSYTHSSRFNKNIHRMCNMYDGKFRNISLESRRVYKARRLLEVEIDFSGLLVAYCSISCAAKKPDWFELKDRA